MSDLTRCPNCKIPLTPEVSHDDKTGVPVVQLFCDMCGYEITCARSLVEEQADTVAIILPDVERRYAHCTKCYRAKFQDLTDPLCLNCRANEAQMGAKGSPQDCARCGEPNTQYERDSLCKRCLKEDARDEKAALEAAENDESMGARHLRDVMVSE